MPVANHFHLWAQRSQGIIRWVETEYNQEAVFATAVVYRPELRSSA
jgi:hypothetical protein